VFAVQCGDLPVPFADIEDFSRDLLSSRECWVKAQELRVKAMKTRDPIARNQFLELVKGYEFLTVELKEFSRFQLFRPERESPAGEGGP
jgi:hypothetical protein